MEIPLPDEQHTPEAPRLGAFSRATLAGSALLMSVLCIAASISFVTAPDRSSRPQQAAAAHVLLANPSPFQNVTLQAKAAYVQDLTTGKVLYEHNADVQLPLASITKVALVLVISEVLQPDENVIISRDAVMRGEGGGLGTGDTWLVGDLIDFTLLASSNAGAEALADAADAKLLLKYPDAPESHATVWRMNALAKDLGLTKTYFLNGSGLDASKTQPGSVSSARDVGVLFLHVSNTARELFKSTAERGLQLGPQNGKPKTTVNTNEALPDIPGLIMGKTGYTDLAGGNLAILFDVSPGHPVVAVVLGSTHDGRFEDMKKLVDAGRASVNAD